MGLYYILAKSIATKGDYIFTCIACVLHEREKLQLFSMKVGKGTSSCTV